MGRAAGWGRPKRGLFSRWSRFLGTKLLEPQNARAHSQRPAPTRRARRAEEPPPPLPLRGPRAPFPDVPCHLSALHRRPRRGRSPRVAPAASSPASGLRPPPRRAPAARRCQAVQSPGAASSPPTVAQVFGPVRPAVHVHMSRSARHRPSAPAKLCLPAAKLAGASEPLLGCAGVTPTPHCWQGPAPCSHPRPVPSRRLSSWGALSSAPHCAAGRGARTGPEVGAWSLRGVRAGRQELLRGPGSRGCCVRPSGSGLRDPCA